MKKKLLIISILILSLVFVFIGCSASVLKNPVTNPQTETDFVVYGNGTSAVQYGNYVYFVNGTRGYEDEDGNQNKWDTSKVAKGGLYRAELTGEASAKIEGKAREFNIKFNDSGDIDTDTLEFKTTQDVGKAKGKDYDGEEIDVVNVELISPKTIGTSGQADNGIYIFDNYIYYATPNNKHSKSGTVLTGLTDFMRTSLDGTETVLIYTTDGESKDNPYTFHKSKDGVYLACYFDKKIVTVKCDSGTKFDAKVLTDDATSVVFAKISEYNKFDNFVMSIEDYVFYTRTSTANDGSLTGTVIEAIRYNGTDSFLFMGGDTTEKSLIAIKDELVFYSVVSKRGQGTVGYYTDLHETLLNVSADYKARFADNNAQLNRKVIVGTLGNEFDLANCTQILPYRSNTDSQDAFAIIVDASAIRLLSNYGVSKVLYLGTATINIVKNNEIYFFSGTGESIGTDLLRINTIDSNQTATTISDNTATTTGLSPAYVAGYVMYFGTIDDYASGYSCFVKVDGDYVNLGSTYIGRRIEADLKPADTNEDGDYIDEDGNVIEEKDADIHKEDDGHFH